MFFGYIPILLTVESEGLYYYRRIELNDCIMGQSAAPKSHQRMKHLMETWFQQSAAQQNNLWKTIT